MKVFYWEEITSSKKLDFFSRGSCISVGSFDGPHLGHEALFVSIKEKSFDTGCLSGIITFKTPVSLVKDNSKNDSNITTFEQRMKIFESKGFDFVILIEFNESFSKLTGEEFFLILLNKLNIKFVSEGLDFCCGRNASFKKNDIQSFCDKNGIECVFHDLKCHDGKRISSTAIRKLINDKQYDEASLLLGWNYKEFVNS